MKATITITIDIDDKYVQQWEKDQIRYHKKLYKSEKLAKKHLNENPLEKTIAEELDNYLMDCVPGVIGCKVNSACKV